MTTIVFYVFAALAVLSAMVVIGQRNPVNTRFGLIVTSASLSGSSGAWARLIAPCRGVYAGAIMVLFGSCLLLA